VEHRQQLDADRLGPVHGGHVEVEEPERGSEDEGPGVGGEGEGDSLGEAGGGGQGQVGLEGGRAVGEVVLRVPARARVSVGMRRRRIRNELRTPCRSP
jgi:hypothetical protein